MICSKIKKRECGRNRRVMNFLPQMTKNTNTNLLIFILSILNYLSF